MPAARALDGRTYLAIAVYLILATVSRDQIA
jgi:hypothetical protein